MDVKTIRLIFLGSVLIQASIFGVAAIDGAHHVQRDFASIEEFSSKIVECCSGHRCDGYRGLKSTTISGKTCQRWDSQTPHSHSITKERYPNSGLVKNYCRNADHEPDGAWCYTMDKDTRWEYCGISDECPECCLSSDCSDYRGRIAKTESGKDCQAWSSEKPHKKQAALKSKMDSGELPMLTENFCRNANGHETTWCYTVDPDTRWENCNTPRCSATTMMTATPTTKFQQILPVEGDFASLKDAINRCIFEKECDIINLGKQLSIFEERDARLQKKASELKKQLKSSKEKRARLEEEVSRLKMQCENTTDVGSLSTESPQILPTPTEFPQILKFSDDRAFLFMGEGKTDADYKKWEDAREMCKIKGGDLATHLTNEVLEFVFSKSRYPYNYKGWIGGRMNPRATQSNFTTSFEWLNGDRVNNGLWESGTSMWQTGEPYNFEFKCMYITRSRRRRKDSTDGFPYLTAHCEKSMLPYLCEFK